LPRWMTSLQGRLCPRLAAAPCFSVWVWSVFLVSAEPPAGWSKRL